MSSSKRVLELTLLRSDRPSGIPPPRLLEHLRQTLDGVHALEIFSVMPDSTVRVLSVSSEEASLQSRVNGTSVVPACQLCLRSGKLTLQAHRRP